jgi:glyoxylase-like metal-dependent hydrolase (beta-lactamase superfamily II)
VRAVSVHPDAIVVTSLLWQCNAIALRAGGEAMLVDSPYFPDELELLSGVLTQSGFEPNALLATHGDFDHMLGRLAFPDLALGVAESTMRRVRERPGEAQRDLRDADAANYVDRSKPLSLGQVQALPVPGALELGDQELQLLTAEGHTPDGMAVWAPWLGVLITGDYLCPVEIPWIDAGGSIQDYRNTLARLAPLVEQADAVVAGHGAPQTGAAAARQIDADIEYLDALERGDERPQLPAGRDTPRQREIHAANLARLAK